MVKLGALYNVGRIDECPAVLDEAFEVLDGLTEHALVGGVHAVAGVIAAQTSLERCVRHLVQGARELELVERPGRETVDAWHNLAVSFSYAGFHAHAMEIAERAYLLGQRLGMPPCDHALPEVAVRRAVSMDHRGDTEGCVRMLRQVLDVWARRTSPSDLWLTEQYYYHYAAARLCALGVAGAPDPQLIAPSDVPAWEIADLSLFGGACMAIAEGRPEVALRRLDSREVNPFTMGGAEVFRLRALAYQELGDFRSAMAADREAVWRATEVTDHLRDRLVDGMRTRLDHEALRRTVERYASEALTDPLTGLPNRRYLDRRMTAATDTSAVGLIDLDKFKAVNTVHGHSGGDMVLQRVAAVLARSVRRGDFVARYGGDEFVVVLPGADSITARDVGSRIEMAVEAEDWEALVAGTPVSVTIGWSELAATGSLAAALEAADQAMLREKHRAPQLDDAAAPG